MALISWNDNMKLRRFSTVFACWFESKRHCFSILVSGKLTRGPRGNQNFMTLMLILDLSDSTILWDMMFIALLFTPIKCL